MKKVFWIFFLILPVSLHALEYFPTVGEVQQKALQYAGLDGKEIHRWRKQARRAPLLPRLQVGFEKNVQRALDLRLQDSVSVTSAGVVVGPTSRNDFLQDDNGMNIEVKAVWYLDQLLFNEQDLAISQEARHLAAERQRLLMEVNEYYFLWKRLAGERFSGSSNRADPLRRVADPRLEESIAYLDAATGGWFSSKISQNRGDEIPPPSKSKKMRSENEG